GGEARRRREEIDGGKSHDQQKACDNDRILPVQEAGKNLEQFFERSVVGSARSRLAAMVGKRRSLEGLPHLLHGTAERSLANPKRGLLTVIWRFLLRGRG